MNNRYVSWGMNNSYKKKKVSRNESNEEMKNKTISKIRGEQKDIEEKVASKGGEENGKEKKKREKPDGNWEHHQSGETNVCSGSQGNGRS
jgi:hypothetical protein